MTCITSTRNATARDISEPSQFTRLHVADENHVRPSRESRFRPIVGRHPPKPLAPLDLIHQGLATHLLGHHRRTPVGTPGEIVLLVLEPRCDVGLVVIILDALVLGQPGVQRGDKGLLQEDLGARDSSCTVAVLLMLEGLLPVLGAVEQVPLRQAARFLVAAAAAVFLNILRKHGFRTESVARFLFLEKVAVHVFNANHTTIGIGFVGTVGKALLPFRCVPRWDNRIIDRTLLF